MLKWGDTTVKLGSRLYTMAGKVIKHPATKTIVAGIILVVVVVGVVLALAL